MIFKLHFQSCVRISLDFFGYSVIIIFIKFLLIILIFIILLTF